MHETPRGQGHVGRRLVPGAMHLDWLHFQCRGRRGAWGHMQALVAAWVWEALVEGGNGEKGQGGRRHRCTLLPQCACPSSPFSPGVCLEQELQGDQRRKKRFISPSPPHSPPPPIKSHDMKLQLNCVGKPGTFLFIWDNSTELTQIFNCGFTAFVLRGVWPFVAFWIVAPQALSSMGFFRQEYWRGLPCPPPRDLPHPGIEPTSPVSPALQGKIPYPLSYGGGEWGKSMVSLYGWKKKVLVRYLKMVQLSLLKEISAKW